MTSLNERITRCFESIIGRSTSYDHVTAHKLYTQLRLENGKYSEMGKVLEMEAEKDLEGWSADCVERIELDGEVKTRTVEILNPKVYPHTFFCENTEEGRKRALMFLGFLKETGYLEKKLEDNLYKRIGEIGHGKREQVVLHFWLGCDRNQISQINWGRYGPDVNNPTEIARKYELWNYQTDKMGFVVCNEYAAYFLADLKKLKKYVEDEGKEFGIDMLALVKRDHIDKIKAINGGHAILKGTSPLNLPRNLREKALLEIWSLEDLL
jgi:hypothetical protein